MLVLRPYAPTDSQAAAAVFHSAVHSPAAAEVYFARQLNAWAPEGEPPDTLFRSLAENVSLVAELDGWIAGFGSITQDGYLDYLFVHPDYQGQRIGSAVCSVLEQAVPGDISVRTSLAARRFFERRGYEPVRRLRVRRRGVFLPCWFLKLHRRSCVSRGL